MTEQAMPVRSGGKVCVSEYGNVKIHTYISPGDGLLTNTQIVEGPTKLIVFDGQFFLPYAEESATYIESLAKPVDRIVLSHIHLDHWSGLPVLAKRFPDAPICGLAGVGDYLRANGQKILDARRPAFGDRIPSHPPVLTGTLPEGDSWIDGVRFEFKRFIDAESALQLVALMPDQQTLLGFDLVFGPNDHVFTVTAHFGNWIAILEGLNARPGCSRILSGHGEPTVHSAINATIAYLQKAREAHAATSDPMDYASRMKATFHNRQNPGWVDISASLLYEVVDAYVTDRS
jgi:hypothetical protein